MLEKIEVLCHSSIKITKGVIIYFDPFKIKKEYHDADLIFITHSHYDHFSLEDINKVRKEGTIIIATEDLLDKLLTLGFTKESIIIVKQNENFNVKDINFKTIPAYNTNKNFHPKENNWVGYLLTLDNTIYFIAGDTDITKENRKVKCDVAFVPVGGTYTMTVEEAAKLINEIKPKIAIPTHYGEIVGDTSDKERFVKLINTDIEYKVFIK